MKAIFQSVWFQIVQRIIRKITVGLGIFLFVAIILSFTDLPFWAYYWLGTHNADLDQKPNLIVLMGGGGMPSGDGLMRCYSTVNIAFESPDAKILIAVPSDTARKEESPELLMARELILRGIDSTRFIFEPKGSNTYTQVKNIRALFNPSAMDTLAMRIVTSPEHMFRSVKAFRKSGFLYVGGQPAFGKDIPEELLEKKSLGASPKGGLNLRYNIWNYLKYEITVVREYCAIVYYKLRGWI